METSKEVGFISLRKGIEMKNLFILLSVLTMISSSINISHSAQYWAKIYEASTDQRISSIQQTADGGYVSIGYVYDQSDYDIWVLKLDAEGEFSWGKTYGGGNYDYASSFQQTSDGGYVLGGRTQSYGSGSSDTWILKLDPSGTVTWQKTYGGIDDDFASSIKPTIDGGFIVAGKTESFGTGTGDALILKLDSNGNISWQKIYSRIGGASVSSISETSDGSYIAAGIISILGSDALLILKLEVNGDVSWHKTYSDVSYASYRVISIQQTTDDGYIVACNYETSFFDSSPLILKLDSNGDISWQKIKWSSAPLLSFTQATDDGYIMAGKTVTTHWGNLWVLKIDSDGNGSWRKNLGNAASAANAVQKTMDGGYVVAGLYDRLDGDTRGNLVLKLDSNGEIPDCDFFDTDPSLYTFSASLQDTTITFQPSSVTITETSVSPQNVSVEVSTLCSSDLDDDGIPNNQDNCPLHPNSSMLGICTWYHTGYTCLSDEECGTGGFCSMDQADDINCDCKANFDCDFDVDGTDAALFKADFGRSPYVSPPCDYYNPCNGDFNCDGDVDGTDAAEFKLYFGIVPFPPYNYCLSCVDGVYQYECSYPIYSE